MAEGPAANEAVERDENMSEIDDIMVDRLTIGDIMELECGTHEVDEDCDVTMEAGDLQSYKCPKNPGHKGFIPVREFKVDHLPQCYRDDAELFDLVKVVAELTVKLKMFKISPDRPKHFPGTERPYPFHERVGKKVTSFATGRVFEVLRNKVDGATCPCPGCKKGATPSFVWGEVNVVTATHAVFDDVEAKETQCTLGYDDADSDVITLQGVGVHQEDSDPSTDRSWLICATCDLDLLDRLEKTVSRFEELSEDVADRYLKLKGKDHPRLTIVVSHPHGRSKQISVGRWAHRHRAPGDDTSYNYTACTCPASSGAPVINIGTGTSFFNHIHAGTSKNGNNFSGYANESGAQGFSIGSEEDANEMLKLIMDDLEYLM